MKDRYWKMLTDRKYELLYLGMHLHNYIVYERTLNICMAVISTGSLAGLVFVESWRFALTVILALAQVISEIRPYLPYESRIRELDNALIVFNIIYGDIEKDWYKVSADEYNDNQINDLIYKYRKKWEEQESKTLRLDSLPQNKRIIKRANEDKEHYFKNMFGE